MSRNQTPTTPGGPVSFKSNPQRNKTTKWTKAPTYNYEGDDWGGYDDGYYGYDDAPPPPPPVPSQMPLPSQMPYHQGRPRDRTNSFDHGDEGRNFSAPVAPPPSAFPAYEEQRRPSQDVGPRSAASAGRGSNDFPRSKSRPRDFTNPEQVPPPLSTRVGATPMSKNSPTPNEWFPPRKSSLRGGTAEAAAQAAEARAIAESVTKPPGVADSEEKPLPFIRPSDIYKRIPEERRRQSESEEGARPSMDTLQREISPTTRSLEPVAESRESRLFMDDQIPGRGTKDGQSSRPGLGSRELRDTSPTLPQLAPVSGFGDEFTRMLHGGSESTSRPAPYTGEHDTTPTANVPETTTSASTAPSDSHTNFSSLQTTPTMAQAPHDRDPAAQIAAERQHDVPVEAIANQAGGGLQHQGSLGFRSTVHQAFDRDDAATLSRDNSEGRGSSGIGRSDTSSTAGISPIMSRVPAAWQSVTPIAEESSTTQTPTASRPGSGLQGQHRISRKPSPGSHSRNASAEHPAGFEPGYRRSLDPPSTGTSPARTPEFESTANNRLSSGMSAVPVTETEAPDVTDQAAEVPDAHFEPVETPASEVSEVGDLGSAAVYKPLPTVTRGRSGTDYSEREADLAATIKSSPDKVISQPAIAEAQRDSQKLFLDTHQNSPRSTSPYSPSARIASPRTGTPTHSGRADSPAKSRVREIADKFHQIHEHSRRNSATSIGSGKSSWSQFSTDAPRLKRQGTSQSNLASESTAAGQGTRELVGLAAPEPRRPQLGSEDSFRPDLPGGWISTAPTPSIETLPPLDRDAVAQDSSPLTPTMPQGLERATSDEKIDLTPTTKKHQLREIPAGASSEAVPSLQRAASDEVVDLSPTRHYQAEAQPAAFAALKQHGDQLGSSFISQYGVGHQTRDFASAAPAAPVDQPETQNRAPPGAIFAQPHLMRMESDSTNAPTSVASSVAPTPPARDTGSTDSSSNSGHREYFDTVAPLRLRSREASPETQQLSPRRPGALPSLSTATGNGEMDSERLRHEIVRSLDDLKKDDAQRQSIVEDAARTQDALDAPSNERRIEHGQEPLPTVETRPGFLNTRFSWENREEALPPSHKAIREPEPRSPEVKPEMPYERGHDKTLHVMNPEEGADSPVAEDVPVLNKPPTAEHDLAHSLSPASTSDRVVSPMTRSQDHLDPENTLQPNESKGSLQNLAPSSISEDDQTSRYLPSYYANPVDDSSSSSTPHAPEKTHENAASMSPAPESTSRLKTNAPIPPFRNILAMKTADERIHTYNETRETFASMNTGLVDWLNKMLETHPEHANLSTSYSGFKAPALQSSGTTTFKRGHKANPSLANFKNKFGSGGETQRTTSVGSTDGPGSAPQKSTFGDGKGVDMDEVKAKGKEFMKNANVLGGKASQGAKSWFNKSKSRLASGSGTVKGGKNEALSRSFVPVSSSPAVASALNESKSAAGKPVLTVSAASADSNDAPASLQQQAPTSIKSPLGGMHSESIDQGPTISETAAIAEQHILPAEPQLQQIHDDPASTFDDPALMEGSVITNHPMLNLGGSAALGQSAANVPKPVDETSLATAGIAPSPDTAVTWRTAEHEVLGGQAARTQSEGSKSDETVLMHDHDSTAIGRVSQISGEHVHVTTDPELLQSPNTINDTLGQADEHAQPLTRARSPDLASAHVAASQFEAFGDAPVISPLMSPTLASPGIHPSPSLGLQSPTPHSLSRQTSRSSPLRMRDQSQTPSSTRTGNRSRPLSQVFGRIKDKARSISRSSNRSDGDRERSRPVSLVLTNPDLLESREEDFINGSKTDTNDFAHNDITDSATSARPEAVRNHSSFSVLGMRSTERRVGSWEDNGTSPDVSRVISMSSLPRTEAWNEPDAQLPPKTPEKQTSEPPRRLGVLPSPAPTTTTFDGDRRASLEVAKRRNSAAPFFTSTTTGGDFGAELGAVPSAEAEDDVREGRSLSKDGDGEIQRSRTIRRSSDLGQLPSVLASRNEHEYGAELSPLPASNSTEDAQDGSVGSDPQKQIPADDTQPCPVRHGSSDLKHSPDETVADGERQPQVVPVTVLMKTNTTTDADQDSGLGGEESAALTAPQPQAQAETGPPRPDSNGNNNANANANAKTKPMGLAGVIATATDSRRPQQHQRKVSDIDLLPSQRRISSAAWNNANPDSTALSPLTIPSSNESVDVEDELYTSSPLTIKQMSPLAGSSGHQETPVANDPHRHGNETTGIQRNTSTGHEREIEKMEREIREAAASPAAVLVPAAANVSHDSDAHSEVSAEGGALDGLRNTTSASRTSSVSSIGAQDVATHKAGSGGADIANAGSAGPISAPLTTSQSQPSEAYRNVAESQMASTARPSLAPVDYQQRFADRGYQHTTTGERPMSYMQLPRDDTGVPVPESISTGGEEAHARDTPVDVSALSGPPSSTPPFQQHPVLGDSSDGYGHLRQSIVSTSEHSRQSSGDVFAGAPPPNRITDQHGLEDVHSWGSVSAPAAQQPSPQQDQKPTRRMSGIWEALSSKRSSKVDKVDSSRESSIVPSSSVDDVQIQEQPYRPPIEDLGKRNTLRKPQRTESSADPTKKKRFSRLGSLFGRSNTSAGDNSRKQNRLTKNLPPSREDSMRLQTPQSSASPPPANVPPPGVNLSTATGSIRGYDAYEAQRRRENSAFQANVGMQPVSDDAQQQRTFCPRPPAAASGAIQPPPQGWYGPQHQQTNLGDIRPQRTFSPGPPRAAAGAVQPSYGPPVADFRRLHSGGNSPGRTPPLARVPEAFRPTEVGFTRAVEPIGPPLRQQPPPMFRNFSSSNVQEPVSPTFSMDRAPNPTRTRQISEVSQLSSPLAARSEAWPPSATPIASHDPVSPVRSRDGQQNFPLRTISRDGEQHHLASFENRSHQQTYSTGQEGFVGEDITRGPIGEYAAQQTPSSMGLPPAGEQVQRTSRAPSWPTRPDGRPMSSERHYSMEQDYDLTAPQLGSSPPRPAQYYQARALQQQHTSPQTYYPHPPQSPPRQLQNIPREDDQPLPQKFSATGGPYPSPPYSSPPSQPSTYSPPQMRQPHLQYAGQRPPPLPPGPQHQYSYHLNQSRPSRYYANSQPPQQPQSFPPIQQQRQYSGPRPGMGQRPGTGHQRRPSSGYSGRRDDMTVGEEELIMRGVSYPGQEWDPRAAGRWE